MCKLLMINNYFPLEGSYSSLFFSSLFPILFFLPDRVEHVQQVAGVAGEHGHQAASRTVEHGEQLPEQLLFGR